MWGWKKESRHGGWIFLHPVFRAGRYDLLAHIKRSDEAGKKRPETVASRRRNRTVTEQPVETPTAPKEQGHGQRYLSLDTSLPSSSSAPRFPNFPQPHPHSAPASVSLTQQSRPSHRVEHLETQFATSRPLPSPALISPLFNPDGSHSRPISPPSFASAPRPYLLPPPIFRGPQAEERRLSFESSLHSNQLAETKKRLEMVTSLLDHVLERLGVDETHESELRFVLSHPPGRMDANSLCLLELRVPIVPLLRFRSSLPRSYGTDANDYRGLRCSTCLQFRPASSASLRLPRFRTCQPVEIF